MAEISDMFNRSRVDLASSIPLPAPFVIQLEATSFCNLKCSFCPVNDEATQRYLHKNTMTREIFTLFVHQCNRFPASIKILRIIGNGEPLLNKNLPLFIEQAKESGVFNRVEITTNGTLLTHDISDAIIEAGLDVLKVSLEAADDAKFFEITKVKIPVRDIKEKLAYFFNRRAGCRLYIKCTDAALNTKESREAFISEFGAICDYIFVENVTDIWPGFKSKIISGGRKRYGEQVIDADKHICVQPFMLLSVLADGEVLPCCADWKRVRSLGNIRHADISDIWRSDELRGIRLSLLKRNYSYPCALCGFPNTSQRDNIDAGIQDIICRLELG
jgi:MoaA/NifB/PqqE/SkfB family radical SAM enzyme